ncbi:MAG: DoxX family protein [Solirubrobacteraceae bacterium]
MTWSQRLLSGAFITTGILHFLRPDYFEQIVPAALPAQRELVLISGAAELAGGVGVAFSSTRRMAGLWLVALLIAVFPANINMAVNSERFDSIPPALLWARLPLQGLLIWWAYRATHASRASEAAGFTAP